MIFKKNLMLFWSSRNSIPGRVIKGSLTSKTPFYLLVGYLSIKAFLLDNPGAVEALVEWIRNTETPEWEKTIEFLLPEDHSWDDEDWFFEHND